MDEFKDKNKHVLVSQTDLDEIAARAHREKLDAERAAKMSGKKDKSSSSSSASPMFCMVIYFYFTFPLAARNQSAMHTVPPITCLVLSFPHHVSMSLFS
jgi:hypothetical protein